MSLITPDFGLLFWMTIIFVAVFFLLAKFGFPIITGMVAKRTDYINESLAKAREAQEKLDQIIKTQEQMMEDARKEQLRLLKEASATKDNIIAQAKQQAQEEADKVVASARVQIAAERESALSDIRVQVAELSVAVAEKILRNSLGTESGQMEYVDRLVEEASAKNRKADN